MKTDLSCLGFIHKNLSWFFFCFIYLPWAVTWPNHLHLSSEEYLNRNVKKYHNVESLYLKSKFLNFILFHQQELFKIWKLIRSSSRTLNILLSSKLLSSTKNIEISSWLFLFQFTSWFHNLLIMPFFNSLEVLF